MYTAARLELLGCLNEGQGVMTDTLLKDDLDQGMRKSFALFTEKNSFMYIAGGKDIPGASM